MEFSASKGEVASFFLTIDRNPNITVATSTGPWVSHLTSRSFRTALPNLEYIPDVSLITRQGSLRRLTNMGFEISSPTSLEIICQVPSATQEKP